jgi:hypothetical protein
MSPVRTHFWHVVTRGAGGVSRPEKYDFIGAMPEFIISKLASFFGGTSGNDSSRKCSFDSKKFKYNSRISSTLKLFTKTTPYKFYHKTARGQAQIPKIHKKPRKN